MFRDRYFPFFINCDRNRRWFLLFTIFRFFTTIFPFAIIFGRIYAIICQFFSRTTRFFVNNFFWIFLNIIWFRGHKICPLNRIIERVDITLGVVFSEFGLGFRRNFERLGKFLLNPRFERSDWSRRIDDQSRFTWGCHTSFIVFTHGKHGSLKVLILFMKWASDINYDVICWIPWRINDVRWLA